MHTRAQSWVLFASLTLASTFDVTAWSLNKILLTGPKVSGLTNGLSNSSQIVLVHPAYLAFSESVAIGARKGLEECKHQFKWDRWNCPETSTPLFSPNAYGKANKETSFVHAIVSAGVMYVLTQNCSLGTFDKCTCDDSKNGQKDDFIALDNRYITDAVKDIHPPSMDLNETTDSTTGGPTWKWGGCSDNIQFGAQVSMQFVDNLESGNDARAATNLHNNEVGRRAIRKTMKMTCKCHGVSGSCTTKTCWQQLAEFRKIGDFLKRRYIKAVHVDYQDGKLKLGNVASSGQAFPAIAQTDLVYLESSPNYCKANLTAGTEGTVGRECARPKRKSKSSKWEKRSCKRLCKSCGLRVSKRLVEVTSSCNCKFHWCCAVKCEQCVRKVHKFTCRK